MRLWGPSISRATNDTKGVVDGACAVVLKRLDDAVRDGDSVKAIVGEISDIVGSILKSQHGATSGFSDFVQSCRDLEASTLSGQYWIHDAAAGPRTLFSMARGPDNHGLNISLCEDAATSAKSTKPIVERPEGIFLLSGDTPASLLQQLGGLKHLADQAPVESARFWFESNRPKGKLGLGFVANTSEQFTSIIAEAESHLQAKPDQPASDRFFYTPIPTNGQVAFVYPGSGNHFADMGPRSRIDVSTCVAQAANREPIPRQPIPRPRNLEQGTHWTASRRET